MTNRSSNSDIEVPRDPDSFYQELTTRNRHFIAPEVQSRLRELKILIAGCGSTGGACTQSLARLGIENFALADNGSYDLSNLNRQHAYLESLGQNKAEFQAARIRGINPNARLQVHPEGINLRNAEPLVSWADLVMDAVDVTTPTGIAMKLQLHIRAHAAKKPVFSALDMGFCQHGIAYDYRKASSTPLNGRLRAAHRARHPMKALFTIFPPSSIPAHVLPLVRDLLLDSKVSASQLGATSDLLSSIIVAAVIRFVKSGELLAGWNWTLEPLACAPSERFGTWLKGLRLRREINRLLREIE
ncbi:MAG: ThiF family adenylyltransferase [Oligoflexia bacterium]|nr:ThiF family adenylyltransferase [Oligoflexia bacterium]